MATERVIIVGAGGISNAWFGPLKDEGVTVAAVVDLRPEAAAAAIEKHQLASAKPFAELDQALRDVDAEFLIDLTIPDAHCDVTCKALRAGLHVLGEKPMAASMAQARKMVKTAEKTGKVYAVSQSRRWDPPNVALANTLQTGALGTLTTLNCDFFLAAHFGGFRDEMPSPLILDMAIHHFDLARYFSGANAVSVYAEEFNPAGSWYKGDVAANCLFEMTNGIHFAYRGSWCAEGPHTGWHGDWRIIGDRGSVVYANDRDMRGEVVTGHEGFFRPKGPLTFAAADGSAKNQHGALREFLAFLRGGPKPISECHDNIHSLAMVFAAIESAKRGRRVKVSLQ